MTTLLDLTRQVVNRLRKLRLGGNSMSWVIQTDDLDEVDRLIKLLTRLRKNPDCQKYIWNFLT